MAAPKQDAVETVHTEKLAYWFFRLNGCLTTENFIVHPDAGRDQRTDADILGVRFPHRAEMLDQPMEDHAAFQGFGDRTMLFVAEVKSRTCRLNGPWTRPADRNMQRVLKAVGALPEAEVETAADALYHTDRYDGERYAVRLFSLADEVGGFSEEHPNAIPITWGEALRFIFRRFRDYRVEKPANDQWEATGKGLFRAYRRFWHTEEAFVQDVRARLVDGQGRLVARHSEDGALERGVA